jgi:hypothetical protein
LPARRPLFLSLTSVSFLYYICNLFKKLFIFQYKREPHFVSGWSPQLAVWSAGTMYFSQLRLIQVQYFVLFSIADPGCLSWIPDPDFYLSQIPDPGSGSWILDRGSRIQKQQQKRGEQKCVVIHFFVATNFTQMKIILCLKCRRKKFGSNF